MEGRKKIIKNYIGEVKREMKEKLTEGNLREMKEREIKAVGNREGEMIGREKRNTESAEKKEQLEKEERMKRSCCFGRTEKQEEKEKRSK